MPIQLPVIDDRTYEQLVRDALARVPVHTPEWTHTGSSDPGVTLVELFGFMAETLLYRANLIPERNRLKFLQLLGQPVRPATPAHGLVTLTNKRGDKKNVTLPKGLSFFAGSLPFRSEAGLDVPPIDGFACIKQTAIDPAPELVDYYRQLYEATGLASGESSDESIVPVLYDTVALSDLVQGYDPGSQSVDGALWIALLVPEKLDPDTASKQLAGRTLSIGLIPRPHELAARMVPGTPANPPPALTVWMPVVSGAADSGSSRFQRLDSSVPHGFPDRAGILQVTMPADSQQITTWPVDEPLEAGVGDRPPMLTDEKLQARVLSWLRIDGLATSGARILWAGLHCTPVTQRYRVVRERLAPGDGESDQRRWLAHQQIVAESMALSVAGAPWEITDELAAAAREDQPGAGVFAVDREAGQVQFGDGVHGARPALGAELIASYDWTAGRGGNVAAGAINRAQDLAEIAVANPWPTEGGTNSEPVEAAERRIPLVLRHRDRAVSADDFRAILHETPGVDLGRTEVLAAWHPELSPAIPGDQPGVVTVMVIPRADPLRPETPTPSSELIDALCAHLAPRRLVTCEVLLRPPSYTPIWISTGVELVAGESFAIVRERVRAALREYLSPLPAEARGAISPAPGLEHGWPLFRSVTALELAAVVARVQGVAGVAGLLLADGAGVQTSAVAMRGLQLPYIAGLSVAQGDPAPLSELLGQDATDSAATGGERRVRALPVPKVPDEC